MLITQFGTVLSARAFIRALPRALYMATTRNTHHTTRKLPAQLSTLRLFSSSTNNPNPSALKRLSAKISAVQARGMHWVRRVLSKTSLVNRPSNVSLLDSRAVLKDAFQNSFGPMMLGFCFGGLFSSILTVLYLNEQDRRRAANGSEKKMDEYQLPHPKLASFGWTLLGAFATVSIGLTRTHIKHALRHFVEHVNFSLNILRDGRFSFRTVLETHVTDIFRDDAKASAILIAEAKKTTPEAPFILLPPQEHSIITNALINTLSPVAAPGFFAQERGQAVTGGWYRLALTFEDDIPEEKARKIRVLIASEDMLATVTALKEKPHSLDHLDSHYRFRSIQKMAELMAQEKTTGKFDQRLIRLHMVWPAPAPAPVGTSWE